MKNVRLVQSLLTIAFCFVLSTIFGNLAFAQGGAPPPEVYEQGKLQMLMILSFAIGLPVSIGICIGLYMFIRKRKKQTAIK